MPIVSDEPMRKRTLPARTSPNRRCLASDFLKSCMKAISEAGTPMAINWSRILAVVLPTGVLRGVL